MTDLEEVRYLQKKAREAGRICTLVRETEDGEITDVLYLDPKGSGRLRAGCLLSVLSFVEIERAAPHWHEMPESRNRHEILTTPFHHHPDNNTPGMLFLARGHDGDDSGGDAGVPTSTQTGGPQ